MTKKNFGNKFKKLRLEKNYSLDSVANGIAPKSSLYNWENGKGNMSFEKVISMLNRMHIDPTEFVIDDLNNYIDLEDIANAYLENNKIELEHLTEKALIKSRNNSYNKKLLIRAAIGSQCLKSLIGKNLFSNNDVKRLETILSDIDDWHYEEIFCFGNTLSLLAPKRIYGLTKSLIRKYIQNNNYKYFKWQHAALNTIINAMISLLYENIYFAKKLFPDLQVLQLDDTYAYEKIRLKFIDEVIYFLKTNDVSRIKNLFFPFLNYIGLNQLSSDLKISFSQLKKIYSH